MHADRSARSFVRRSRWRELQAFPGAQRGSSRRTASATPGHGRRTRPVRPCRTASPRLSARSTPTCTRFARHGRPTKESPGRRRCRDGGLDARRDAARRESAAVGGIEQLDVLEPGHERDDAGGRFEDVEGCPNGSVADGMDLGRDVRLGSSPREMASSSGGVTQTPRRRSGGRGRSGSASMSARRAAVREPSEPSAKHFCQPTRALPFGSSPTGEPLREAPHDRRFECIRSE